MANEQTSVPLYAASEVLTAANMNISAGTGVPVFATTVTRDAAFGGASEKVLAEGQLCYLSASNIVQYYDGAAWATVGPAAAGGLTFISSTAFTTAASVSLPVATFSATYLNYLVLFNLSAASTDINLTGRLRIAGADNTTSNYATMLFGLQDDGTTQNVSNTAQSSFTLKSTNNNPTYAASFTFLNPFATVRTNILTQISSVNPGVAPMGSSGTLLFNATTSFDSFSFIASTGTITGTVKVYGYANS